MLAAKFLKDNRVPSPAIRNDFYPVARWTVATFSGHISNLKGAAVSGDLGGEWSAAFIVRTGGDSPIKGTFVYLSAPISMYKSVRVARFMAARRTS